MKKALLSVLAAGLVAATAAPAVLAEDYTAIDKAVAYVDGHASDIKAEVESLPEVQKVVGTKDYAAVYNQAYNDVRNKYIKKYEALYKKAQNIQNHPNTVDPQTGEQKVPGKDNKNSGQKVPGKKVLPKTSAAK